MAPFLSALVEPSSAGNTLMDIGKYLIMGAIATVSTYTTIKIEEAREIRKEKRKEEERVKNLEKTLSYNNSIQRSMKELLIQIQGYTECSRASILNYHNGTRTHFDFCMNFVSMTEEKTDGIVASIIDSFQRVPAAVYRPIIDKIDFAEDGYAMISRDDLDEDDKALMDKYQNKVCYYFRIGGSVWEGVVELAWVNKKITLSESEISHVQELVNSISDLQRKLLKS